MGNVGAHTTCPLSCRKPPVPVTRRALNLETTEVKDDDIRMCPRDISQFWILQTNMGQRYLALL